MVLKVAVLRETFYAILHSTKQLYGQKVMLFCNECWRVCLIATWFELDHIEHNPVVLIVH